MSSRESGDPEPRRRPVSRTRQIAALTAMPPLDARVRGHDNVGRRSAPLFRAERPKRQGPAPQANRAPTPSPTQANGTVPHWCFEPFQGVALSPGASRKGPADANHAAPRLDRSRAAVQGERRRGSIGRHGDQFRAKFRFCQYNSFNILTKRTSILAIGWLSSRAIFAPAERSTGWGAGLYAPDFCTA